MKRLLIILTVILSTISPLGSVFAQTSSFFKDISLMEVSVCFDDKLLKDAPFEIKKMGSTSSQAFFDTDSSQVIVVRLYNRRANGGNINSARITTEGKPRATRDRDKNHLNYLIPTKYLKKINANFGGVTLADSIQYQDNYALEGNIMLEGKTGIIHLSFYRHEGGKSSKKNRKDLIKLASNLVRYN